MIGISADRSQVSRKVIGVVRPRVGRRDLAIVGLVLILLVSWFSYLYYFGTPRAGRNIVGIIKVEGSVLTSSATDEYFAITNQAMLNESVKAVVLVIDSPGGYADLIEQVYLDLLKLNETKPVVASVVMALSGGYYIAVAARYIYVHPTSFVGNIGVIGVGPPVLIPSEQAIETGAYKVPGFSELLFPYNMSHALDNFVSAVERGRGDRLRLSSTHLRRGLVYLGSEAVEVGLADETGSVQDAIAKAAEEASLVEYEVAELRPLEEAPLSVSSSYGSVEWQNLTVETLGKLYPPPAIYYLYLPPGTFAQVPSSPQYPATASGVSRAGRILVDVSHGNSISWWELNVLIGELAKKDIMVSFVSQWENLDSALSNASCLIVAAPTEAYSVEEGDRIERFVRRGGLLLLFFDPAAEYVSIPELFAPANSLSTRFGISFGNGYLYNEVEHFGIYRNIYVRDFTRTSLAENLSSIVLFTATRIDSRGKAVASTSNDTYSSVSEKAGSYATIVSVDRGNGTAVAFGDLTFLREPYCYVEDNHQLLMNVVSLIASIEVPPEEVEEGVEDVVVKPSLPVGTEKNFTEWVDGEESPVRWLKVKETEVRVERPNRTTCYYLTEDEALSRWVSDGTECVYEDPLPESPYPLTKGKSWQYESNFTMTVDGKEYKGKITGQEEVEGFDDVVAGDGKTYFCARVRYTQEEHLLVDGTNMTMTTRGDYWVSSEAGTVQEETSTRYYVDGIFTGEEKRTLLLESIRKEPGS